MHSNEIVVGLDGSAQSRAALRFAVAQARRMRATVRVVTAFDYNWGSGRFGGSEEQEQAVRARHEKALAEAIEEVRPVAADVTVAGSAVLGEPAPVLLNAGKAAVLTVVGNRGRGGFGSLLLGSVSQKVATHARHPVVVVRGTVDTATGPVIVGVDHTDHSEHTIGAAFEEAVRRGSSVIAIHAYEFPAAYGVMAMSVLPYKPEDLRDAEVAALETALEPWREKFPGVPVEALVARGTAARVLVDVSSNAGLVVVGSRGHGGVAGTLLGSVGLQVLHHADCPVMIVHPTDTPAPEG
ncbi:universal stress protein [Virgisporangium aurantiacum]|uniref:Universal stress protein n=1 Tax=Virgisporangium aurantiacum TaxID=175570 RepID=A0A8J3Z1M8_9ACTN|nr:universal stress protein [Virgisporangium aurantiacum]GIJ54712.1 universal stress protein [Virgisporangium aurantiacum]